MKISNSTKEHIDIISSIVASIGIPAMLYVYKVAGMLENIIIGILIFILWRVVMVYVESSEIKNVKEKIDKMSLDCKLTPIFNKALAEIERYYQVLHTEDEFQQSFFARWYDLEITRISTYLCKTLTDKYVIFSASKLQNESHPIYEVFDPKDNNFFYATCTCGGISWWLKSSGEHFIKNIQKNVKNGNIKHVWRVFIYKDKKELDDPLVRLCFALHTNGVYKFKIISKDVYAEKFGDKDTTGKYKQDFGIYGNTFVWETIKGYGKNEVRNGKFSMNKESVHFYSQFFNTIWETAENYPMKNAPVYPYPKNSLADLSKLYKTQPKSG